MPPTNPIARAPILLLLLLGPLAACGPGPNERGARTPPPPHAVETVQVRVEALEPVLERPATLEARRELRVFTRGEGALVELPYHEGDRVETGAVLARLDERLLQGELRKALANQRQARDDRRRLQRLTRGDLVAKEELERAHTALDVAGAEVELLRTRLDQGVIRAPFDGVVSERLAEPGDAVARYTHLLTLTDPSSLTAEVPVSELWLPALAKGGAARVRIDALGRHTPTAGPEDHPGRILRIHPRVSRGSRQATVEVELDPVPPGALPGMFCRVRFEVAPRRALLVPFRALQTDRQGEYVYRVDQGKALRTPVTTGPGHGQRVEVFEGLRGGEAVVVRGLLGLRDGKPVQVAEAGSGGP